MFLTLKQAQQKDQTLIHTAELNPPDLPASIMEMMTWPFQGLELIPWTMWEVVVFIFATI